MRLGAAHMPAIYFATLRCRGIILKKARTPLSETLSLFLVLILRKHFYSKENPQFYSKLNYALRKFEHFHGVQ